VRISALPLDSVPSASLTGGSSRRPPDHQLQVRPSAVCVGSGVGEAAPGSTDILPQGTIHTWCSSNDRNYYIHLCVPIVWHSVEFQ
jgi:hypothetical protein